MFRHRGYTARATSRGQLLVVFQFHWENLKVGLKITEHTTVCDTLLNSKNMLPTGASLL